jgi:hypothetical protein
MSHDPQGGNASEIIFCIGYDLGPGFAAIP